MIHSIIIIIITITPINENVFQISHTPFISIMIYHHYQQGLNQFIISEGTAKSINSCSQKRLLNVSQERWLNISHSNHMSAGNYQYATLNSYCQNRSSIMSKSMHISQRSLWNVPQSFYISQGSYEHSFIPAWICNHIHYKMSSEITYPFPNFNGCTIEVWEWTSDFIPHFPGHVITYPC